MRPRPRHLIGGLALAASLLAIGTSVHGVSAQAAVQRAARATLDAGSSRFSIRFEPGGPQLSAYAAIVADGHRIEGLMDYRRHRGTLSTVGPGGFETEVVFDGDVTYMNFRAFALRFGLTKTWFKAAGAGDDAFDPQARALRDPAALLLFLRRASDDVRAVGSERIGGVETVHYAGTLDLARVAANAPPEEREQLRSELEFLTDLGEPSTVPYDVWVDRSDVTRRLRLTQGGTEAALTTTGDFFDFGVPVEITIPAPDEVLTDEELDAAFRAQADGLGDCQTQTDPNGEIVAQTCSRMLFLTTEPAGGK